HITNRFVYLNMPAGTYVLDKIKKKTPKTDAGNYKFKFHQSLTKEKGWELLKKVIYSVEALASISETKDQFKHYIAEKYGQKTLFSYEELDKLSKENDETKVIKNKPKEPLSDFNTKLQIALNHNPKN
ncbi:MAG: P63C domain-containing protein, partial [Bacteroidota bacterium]|nr:P63C domain-containing protein [Bacteroidota bacterium]